MNNLAPEDKFLLLKRVNNLSRSRNTTAIELGMCLVEIQESGAYKDVVGADGSFMSYLADPEVKIPPSSAMRYMGIAKKYIYELNVPASKLVGLDTNCLYRAKDKINSENVDEWLSRIETLSRSDVYRLLKYGETDVMTCEHKWIPLPAKFKCSSCGEITLNAS